MRVGYGRVLLTAVLTALCVACRGRANPASDDPNWRIARGVGFRIAAPDSLKLRENRTADYQLYSLASPSDKVILRIYSGNFPSLFKLPDAAAAALQGKATMSDTTILWQSGASLRGRETLIRLGEGVPYPEFVHAWYDSLTPAAAAEGDSIIRTIRAEALGRRYRH
jgi:hypothetical protein